MTPPSPQDLELAMRWRLVLGRFADQELPKLGPEASNADRILNYLYNRDYRGRGIRVGDKDAGSGGSVFSVPEWLREVRTLFPADVCETITNHALDRYGMTELVTDPETLRKLEPNYELLKTLLTYKDLMQGEALELARDIVKKTVEELRRKLMTELRAALWGRLDPLRRTRRKTARNLDFKSTIRANLRTWDKSRRRLLPDAFIFRNRVQRFVTWQIIIVVDCSGSMVDSVIYSAVMASIFAGLSSVRVKLLAFDTQVVDLSAHVHDPAAILLSVQLGGGTDIAGAMGCAVSMIEQPTHTIVVLVTDFFEGGPLTPLLAHIRKLKGDGVRVLGLAALDQDAKPSFDKDAAAECAKAGAEVGAMTPNRLAEWIGRIIHS